MQPGVDFDKSRRAASVAAASATQMLRNGLRHLYRCKPHWRCYSSIQDSDPSTKDSSSEESIAVNPPLQDLFMRLSQGQETEVEHPKVQDEEMRATGRPRNEAPKQRSKTNLLNPRDVAKIASSFGDPGHNHRLWHLLALFVMQRPEQILYRMSPEEVTKLAWGYARVKVQEQQLFKEIAHHARRCIMGFTPHQLSLLVWAFSEVRQPGAHSLMDVIARQAESRMVEFEPRDLARLLKALGDSNELTLPYVVRFLPSLTASLQALKTPVLLEVLEALAAAVARHRTISRPLLDHTAQIADFLHTAAPAVVDRANHTVSEWQQELQKETQMRGLLWLQREWQAWASVQRLYLQLAHPADKALVQEALVKLERLEQGAAASSSMKVSEQVQRADSDPAPAHGQVTN